MALDRILLTAFRNHAETRLEGARAINLLVGENGAGKTNVLEAISLFAPGRGLRRAALPDMALAGGSGTFAVSASLTPASDDGEPLTLGTGIAADRPGRRLLRINSANASATSLAEWLAMGWLTPAMDGLFMASPGERRRYMDRLALALFPDHARISGRFEAALRERNRMLADELGPDRRWLVANEAQLAEAGAALASRRAALVEALAGALADEPNEPFARPLLIYEAGGPVEAHALAEALAASRNRDIAARRTLTGPHRDDLAVTMAGKGAPAAQCSTGEQKAMLVAITLAHAALAAQGRASVLLLDEVAAHLDPVRREALFDRLRASGTQVWLTGTEPAPFEGILGEAACWRVSGGAVEAL
ncbi:MAG: DNA replication/repair protein RecF [Sphingomonadales bacterium 32-64-17]|nr:MAG: DNA replication/repair protein RecF [Sphingomonadales bacterium 32-64-17]